MSLIVRSPYCYCVNIAGQKFNIIILCVGKVVFDSNVDICCFQLCYMPDGSYTYQASTWSGSLGANDTRQVIFVFVSNKVHSVRHHLYY